MAQANVEAARGVYEHWSQGEFRAPLETLDPLILFVTSADFPDAGSYLGLERLRDYTRGFLEPWSRITIEAEEMIEAGDSVVVAVRQIGVGRDSGVTTELRYFHVWTFRGGRAIRLETLREREQALEAVGLL